MGKNWSDEKDLKGFRKPLRSLMNWKKWMVGKNLELGTWNLFDICYLRFIIFSLSGIRRL